MLVYIIAKNGRFPQRRSYDGPTCIRAGIEGGRVYLCKLDAEADAKALSKVNPVGFIVYPIQVEHP
jgi:hypothetical protein